MSRAPVRLSRAQMVARDEAVADLVRRTGTIIQLAYIKLLEVGIDGPDLVMDYHWKIGVPRPFFRRPNVLNVPLTECVFMDRTLYERYLLEALAMYAAWTEFDAVDAIFRRATDIRHVRRPVKVTANCAAYSDFLRVLKRP